MKRVSTWVAILVLLGSCARWARSPRYGSLESGSRNFSFQHGIELLESKRGMKVALLRDTRTNLVTVDVRYAVGAAEDPAGRAGMAHLVEHLTYEARRTAKAPTIGARLGDVALYHNAWTTHDETHYIAYGLDVDVEELIAIEAQRMQVACEHLDEQVFLRERDVVLEEQAMRASPLDAARAAVAAAVWGEAHPYARRVGSREIADATLEEACAFLDAHYAPDRAILVITGNFDPERIQRALAESFGPIAKKSTGARAAILAPSLAGSTSEHTAAIDQATALVHYRAPAWSGDDWAQAYFAEAYLRRSLAAADAELDWVTSIAVSTSGGYRARVLTVGISVDDPARLDKAVELVHETAAELGTRNEWLLPEALKGDLRTAYMAAWDDFFARGAWIADFLQYRSDHWFFLRELRALDGLQMEAVRDWAAQHLARARSHVALVRPSGAAPAQTELAVAGRGREHDLEPWRTPVDASTADAALVAPTERLRPTIVEEELDNGLRVLFAPDPTSPLVEARLVFPTGTMADPDGKRGTAFLAARLLGYDSEGFYGDADVERIRWAATLGTALEHAVGEETTTFSARGLSVFGDWHVWWLSWLLDQGRYDDDDVAALRKALAELDDEEDLRDAALRARVFGAAHPYAQAVRAAEIASIGAADLEAFRRAHYRARDATLVVTGGFDVDTMRRHVRELFGPWSAGDPPGVLAPPSPDPVAGPSWVGVRDPDRVQPLVTIAFATRSNRERDRAARLVLAEMLRDRVRIVREGLGASYHVHVGYDGLGRGSLVVETALDPARAAKATAALLAEIARVRDEGATLVEDFVRARRRVFARVLADGAGVGELADELASIAAEELPLDFYERLAATIGATTLDEVVAVAGRDLAAARMTVVVSGRGAVIEGVLKTAGATAPELLDAR